MDNGKITVYISGPITGVPDYEKKFEKVATWLNIFGVEAVSPVTKNILGYKTYIDRALTLLRDCDMICMMPGWERSEGAKLEHHYANVVGLPEFVIPDNVWRDINGQS